MTIEDFLLARYGEILYFWSSSEVVTALVEDLIAVVNFHKNWPVLVETEPKFEPDFNSDYINQVTFSVTKQMAFFTQEEYRRKFGSEPPTAPMLLQMVQQFTAHPDFQEEWTIE